MSRARMSDVIHGLVSGLSLSQLASLAPDLVEFSRATILDQGAISRSIHAVAERESHQLPQVSHLPWRDISSIIRCFGIICQHEESCSGVVVPRLIPWLVEALKVAPLTELPTALRRMTAAFAPWPTALESATQALQQWVPGMFCDALARPWDAASGRAEWVVKLFKAVIQAKAVKNADIQGMCKAAAEALDTHSVWIAGILISKPSDRDERVKVIQQWLEEQVNRNLLHLDYMPARAFLVCKRTGGKSCAGFPFF